MGKIARRTLSSMAVLSLVILSFCKDLNFIIINYKFTIHDAPHFAFLYFEWMYSTMSIYVKEVGKITEHKNSRKAGLKYRNSGKSKNGSESDSTNILWS